MKTNIFSDRDVSSFGGAPKRSRFDAGPVVGAHKKRGSVSRAPSKQTEHLLKPFGHRLDVEDLLKGVSGIFVVPHLIVYWVQG